MPFKPLENEGFDILLIDDQPLTEHLIRRMLQDEQGTGLRMDYLQDPLLAETKVRACMYDVILLDLAMPGMDGFELLPRLLSLPQTRSVPIVMLTSNDDATQKSRAFSLGASDYLLKLPDKVEMLARLRHYGTVHRAHLRQKAIERELWMQGNHLRSVLDNALDAIITIDRTGRIVDVNPATVHLLGYSREAMLGQSLTGYILSDAFWHHYAQALQAPHPDDLHHRLGKKWEVDGLRENGQLIDLEMAIVPTTGLEGDHGTEDLRLTAFLHDVTDQKQLLKSLEETLSVAETASRIKSDFLATMSHEIRTPMNAVIGLTDLALQTEPASKTQDYLIKIQGASHSLLRIINDILDFSKMDAGRLKLESVPFILADLFTYLDGLFRKQAEEKGIELFLEVDPACLETLVGDAFRLEQVLINLVGNAVKFTESGYVICQVQKKPPLSGIDVASDGSTCWYEFSVQDTGIGLTATQQNQLFTPFVQADSSTTRRYGGTGLGLSICKRIVEAMDGQIEVESVPGEGSLFRFSVPFMHTRGGAERLFPTPGEGPDISDWVTDLTDLDRSAIQNYHAREESVNHAALAAKLGGIHLLLVEDMPINQQVAKELLEKVGIHVDVAADGASAVRMAAAYPYDAILMDIQMPGMDGYEATRRIRTEPGWAHRPIIAMTAHARFDDREHCLAVGMTDHVSKPIDTVRLYATLTRWVATCNRESVPVTPAAEREKPLTIPEKLPGIDVADGLFRTGGNHTLYRTLLQEFAREFAQAPAQIRRLLAGRRQEDLPTASRRIHAIRGMAGNLAARNLSLAAQALEQAIQAEKRSDWPALLNRFEQAMQQVVAAVQLLPERVEEEEGVAEDPPDPAVITPLLRHLAKLIADGNAEALPRTQEIRPRLRGAGVSSALQRLDACLNQFDFDGAQVPLATIAQALGILLE